METLSNMGSKTKSELEFLGTLDALPFYVMFIDSDHHILLANKAVTRHLGVKPKQIIGEYCPKAIHGLNGPYPGCPVEEAVKTGHAVEKEFFDSDTKQWVKSAAYPTERLTPDGRMIYFHMIYDITEQKQLEEELRKSQKYIMNVIENAGDAIITTDREGQITMWSNGAERLYGYKQEAVLGKTIDFVYPEELKEERKKWQKALLAGKSVKNVRTNIYNSTGDLITIDLTLSTLHDHDGKPIGTVGISHNITDLIKAEKEIQNRLEELENWQRLTTGREIRMVELKNEINELKEKLGKYEAQIR